MYKLIPAKERDKNWFNNQENNSLYRSKDWLETLEESYAFESFLLLNEQDMLLAPFCKVENMMGKSLVSLPFSDYLPLEDNLDFNEIQRLCSQQYPGYSITLKTDLSNEIPEHFSCTKEAVYHRIHLNHGQRLKQSKSFKRGVKQAQKNDLEVRFEHSYRALEDFYKLYHRLRFDKFGIIPQPFSFFESLYDHFIKQKKGIILEAVSGDKVIASMIVLDTQDTAFYKYGSSSLEHLELKPNNILFQELIGYYTEKGFKSIDLGLSGKGDSYAGLRRWKSSMGGTEYPITYWSHQPEDFPADAELLKKNKSTIKNLTDAMIAADLNASQTSLLSKHIYPLLA